MFGKIKIGIWCNNILDVQQTSKDVERRYNMKAIEVVKPKMKLSDKDTCGVLICMCRKSDLEKYLYDTKQVIIKMRGFKRLVL